MVLPLRTPNSRRPDPEHLFDTEKAQRRVFVTGHWRELKAPSGGAHRRGRLRGQPEGDAITRRAPFVDMVFVPRPCTACLSSWRVRGRGTGGHRRQFSRNREVRPAARAAGRRARGLRLHHGGMQQVLHVLRRALHLWRGSQLSARRRRRRGGRTRAGRPRGDAARPERERLSRPDARRRHRRPRHAHPLRCPDRRHASASRPPIPASSTTA